MHNTHIDITLEKRQQIIAILNARLADVVDLGIQAKLAHWNVRGMHFIGLHELFDKVAETANENADDIAERIGQLGGVVVGNVHEVSKNTSLGVFPSDISKDVDIVKAMTQGLADFANNVRKDIDKTADLGDQGTSDLLTDVVRDTDKNLWFVEAHLQG